MLFFTTTSEDMEENMLPEENIDIDLSETEGISEDIEETEEKAPRYTPDEKFTGFPKENIIELTYIDSETVYEDKHIMLFDYFRISDKLTLKNCLVEICGGGFTGDAGKLYLENCEIINPLEKLLSGRFYECIFRDSKIVFANVYPSARVINCDDELLFDTCHFVNCNPMFSKTKPEFEIPPFINAPDATFKTCTFEDFSSFTEIRAGHFDSCNFNRCTEVTANESIKKCNFSQVGCVVFGGEIVEECEFSGLSTLLCEGTVKNCVFSDINTDTESPVITVKGGHISGCTFREISGSGVLAKLYGGTVGKCNFEGISEKQTEELFAGEKKGGFLGLKKIFYNPLSFT